MSGTEGEPLWKIDTDLAWAAGFFDGEGSIRIETATGVGLGKLVVNISQVDRSLLYPFADHWGGGVYKKSAIRPNHRQAWAWICSARKAMRFLEEIDPFVRYQRNKERIALAREFQEGAQSLRWASDEEAFEYASWRFGCYLRMKRLNRRGNPDRAAGRP